ARGDVPDAGGAVVAGADEPPPVAGERDPADVQGVGFELPDLLARLGVPKADHPLAAGRGQALAVGRHGDGGNRVAVGVDLPDLLARGDLDDPNRPVAAGRGEALAVGHHADAVDADGHFGVVLVTGDLLAGPEVPDANRPLAAARDGLLAVGRQGDAVDADFRAVAGQLLQLLARLRVPQADATVGAAGEDALAVLRPVQRGDGVGVPLQRKRLLAGLHVPDAGDVLLAVSPGPGHEPL